MITEAEFDRVQTLLGRHSAPRPITKLSFAFTGLIRCGECNGAVTAEEKHQMMCGQCHFKFAYRHRNTCPHCATPIENMTNPKILRYTYYHCTKRVNPKCTQKSISTTSLDQQIDHYLSRIQISPRFKAWAIRYLHELHSAEAKSRNEDIHAQQRAYNDCLRQLDNLVKLKTSPDNEGGSLLADEEYSRQRMNLLKEKIRLEELLRDSGHRVEKWLTLSEETFAFACAARSRFAKGDSQTKKSILATIGSNLTLKDKKLRIEAMKPFLLLETSVFQRGGESDPFEPTSGGLEQDSNDQINSELPSVLGGLEDVRTLQHRNEYLVKAIYHFFRSVCSSPSFTLSDWFLLYHSGSMDDWKNLE